MKKANLLKRIAVLAMVGAMALTSVATVRATTTTAYAQEVISVKPVAGCMALAMGGVFALNARTAKTTPTCGGFEVEADENLNIKADSYDNLSDTEKMH